MPIVDEKRAALAEKLYEQYVLPIEPDHHGEYVAVSPRGQILFAATAYDAMHNAVARFGRGCYMFKVGERSVGHIR